MPGCSFGHGGRSISKHKLSARSQSCPCATRSNHTLKKSTSDIFIQAAGVLTLLTRLSIKKCVRRFH
jgi:hypothetical protein